MNRAIEIHDSVLDSLTTHEGLAELHFSSAYIHQSEGEPGVDSGSGSIQEAYLKIGSPNVSGSFAQLPLNMCDGYIRLDGTLCNNMIPIPLNHRGLVELRLEGGGKIVSITGTSATVELIGDATYVEEFKP